MRGRRPKPSSIRRLQGNPGRRPIPDDEPKPKRGKPTPPKWLLGEGLNQWREVAQVLDELGVLTVADGFALALLCSAWGDYREASEIIVKEGSTYERMTAAGSTSVVARPEVAIRNDAWKRLKSMLIEFGLTPSSRTGVSVRPQEGKSDLQKFLEGRNENPPN
jgi:P27 family predicted phage terminase small subunit